MVALHEFISLSIDSSDHWFRSLLSLESLLEVAMIFIEVA